MSIQFDHLILNVKELQPSIDFYVKIMGFTVVEEGDPYTEIRANDDFTMLLAPFGTKVSEHLAFALSRDRFEKTFAAVKSSGTPYGDSWDTVGNNRGPGVEAGARGNAPTVYFHDPSGHLLEIRSYELKE
jgi:catechol 2,3-dioxygenase-like lactoylglutathione lyase family enzyme